MQSSKNTEIDDTIIQAIVNGDIEELILCRIGGRFLLNDFRKITDLGVDRAIALYVTLRDNNISLTNEIIGSTLI